MKRYDCNSHYKGGKLDAYGIFTLKSELEIFFCRMSPSYSETMAPSAGRISLVQISNPPIRFTLFSGVALLRSRNNREMHLI